MIINRKMSKFGTPDNSCKAYSKLANPGVQGKWPPSGLRSCLAIDYVCRYNVGVAATLR